MITAAHAIIHSTDAEADREVLREILRGNRPSTPATDGSSLPCLPPRSPCTRRTGPLGTRST
jgi:hypothetical protein